MNESDSQPPGNHKLSVEMSLLRLVLCTYRFSAQHKLHGADVDNIDDKGTAFTSEVVIGNFHFSPKQQLIGESLSVSCQSIINRVVTIQNHHRAEDRNQRGHQFMSSTKNQVFDPLPMSTCVHMNRTPFPLVDVPMRP